MSKNINISITLKELSVLEYFVNNKYIKPTNGINATLLLESINNTIDKQNQKLATELGVTVEELGVEKDKVSRTVLYRMLKKFRDSGIIADGIKDGKTKTMYITTKGVEFYASMMNLSQEDSANLLRAYEQLNGTWEARFEANVKM